MKIHLHAFEPASRANGPGLRAVVWLQGCTLGCPGCFNPGTHDPDAGLIEATETLAERIRFSSDGVQGVSFSGGEPLQQAEALLDLLNRLGGSGLSTLVFSGYTLAEIQRRPLGRQVLERLDVLIAGRYVQSQHLGRDLLGSANQRIHLLSSRYSQSDFDLLPECEWILHADGKVTITGILPKRLDRSNSRA